MGRGGLLIVALMVGCHAPTVTVVERDTGAPSGLDTGIDPDAVDPAFQRVALAFCKVTAKCSPGQMQSDWGGYEECLKRYPRYAQKLATGSGVLMTNAQFAACFDAREINDCSKATREWIERNPPAACRIPGALAAGAPCAVDYQCATGHCAGQCGLCVEAAADGGDCRGDGECDFGLLCRNKKCVRPHDVGEACDANQPCHFDLSCRLGTCVKAPQLGETCLDGADFPCSIVQNLRCDHATDKCVPFHIAAAGEVCNVDGAELCAHGTTCETPIVGQPGHCVVGHPDGTACGNIAHANPGGACINPSTCLSGICRELELADCSNPGTPP